MAEQENRPERLGSEEVPTHRRSINLEVFERGEDFEVIATLRDDRPWATGTDQRDYVHDMELRVTVRRSDLTIIAASAQMSRFPHFECQDIEPAFGDLVGLSVARGYTRAVQERFGRERGCSHLEFLARAIGPVVVQAHPSSAARMIDRDRAMVVMSDAGAAWLRNTCHIWADDGIGPQKVAIGWRPGTAGYPVPPLAELLEDAEQ